MKRERVNPNLRGLAQSATLAINEECMRLEGEGKQVYRLGLGQSPFPVPERVVDALKKNAYRKDYLSVTGLPELRHAVACFHAQRDRFDAQEDLVMIGPGSKELMFLLQVAFDGEVIIPTPSWVSYVPQAKIIGKKVRFIKTSYENRWRIFPEQIHSLYKKGGNHPPRVLVLNYPGNPCGLTYTPDELCKIADAAREHGLVILSDEIYANLLHSGTHTSIAQYYPEGTIVSSGLSKWCGAGGWRLGTFTFPSELRWLMDAMAVVASETYTSVSAPIQYAAVTAFEGGEDIREYLFHARRVLGALGGRCAEILTDASVRVHKPDGGFYLFADFSLHREALAKRGIKTGVQLAKALLDDRRVATLPGIAFNRPKNELSARIAYVNFNGAQALSASRLVPVSENLSTVFIDTCHPDTIEAMRRIVSWIEQ